jgi:hypothetical protein
MDKNLMAPTINTILWGFQARPSFLIGGILMENPVSYGFKALTSSKSCASFLENEVFTNEKLRFS